MNSKVLRLFPVERNETQVILKYSIDDYIFSNTYWYPNINLKELDNIFSKSFMEYVYFHMLLFEANKALSLCPQKIELPSLYDSWIHDDLITLWSDISTNVWRQWRFENDLPGFKIPKFSNASLKKDIPQSFVTLPLNTSSPSLLLYGGGKDSLACSHILEKINEKYSTVSFYFSFYGKFSQQRDLIDKSLSKLNQQKSYQVYVFDDFLESPILKSPCNQNKIKTLTAAETPSTIFATIPIMLSLGSSNLIIGNEKSADYPNFFWESENSYVNHQWGKSLEAEKMIASYIKKNIFDGINYFSILKPMRDPLIFSLLTDVPEKIPFVHSCNEKKPWCKKCPKCLYIWLSYMAYFPKELIDSIFNNNLFNFSENKVFLQELLGLGAKTPFECVGQADESQLAFLLCHRKNITGNITQDIDLSEKRNEILNSISSLFKFYNNHHNIPSNILNRLNNLITSHSENFKEEIVKELTK